MASKGAGTKKATTKAPEAKRAARPTGAPDRPVRQVVDASQPVTSPPEAHPEVVKRVGGETEQGFRGVEVDDTPNENYTVAGVLANKPTPENTRVAGERLAVHALEDGKIVRK